MAPDCSLQDRKPPASLARPNSPPSSSSPASARSRGFLPRPQWVLTSPCLPRLILLPSSLLAPAQPKRLLPPLTSLQPASSALFYHLNLITVTVRSHLLWTPSKWTCVHCVRHELYPGRSQGELLLFFRVQIGSMSFILTEPGNWQ